MRDWREFVPQLRRAVEMHKYRFLENKYTKIEKYERKKNSIV